MPSSKTQIKLTGAHCPGTKTETDPWGINVDGNYWSDYDGTNNGHGVGETPYFVNGTIPDNQPLMNIPSAKLPDTQNNVYIGLIVAASILIIAVIAVIAIKKGKNRLQTPEASFSRNPGAIKIQGLLW